jgi:hypothetical protein
MPTNRQTADSRDRDVMPTGARDTDASQARGMFFKPSFSLLITLRVGLFGCIFFITN